MADLLILYSVALQVPVNVHCGPRVRGWHSIQPHVPRQAVMWPHVAGTALRPTFSAA